MYAENHCIGFTLSVGVYVDTSVFHTYRKACAHSNNTDKLVYTNRNHKIIRIYEYTYEIN